MSESPHVPGEALLEVRDLRTWFYTDAGIVTAVDGVSFRVEAGEVFGLVGESGSGKSVTAMTILGLIPTPPGRVESGQILWKGEDLLTMSEERLQSVRGREISMIFQDPMTSLNPVFTIGQQIAETVRLHNDVTKAEARTRAIDMLQLVGIPRPHERAADYPHQFSGGMRQRAMIAMAIACDPDLLIADEPTTALDVTIQAQVLEVLQRAAAETNSSTIVITHDLGVIAGMADRVAVMYAGQVVEEGRVDELFYAPRMPYTWGLLESIARLDQARPGRLRPIVGTPPSMIQPPSGCRFHPRCPYREEQCSFREPELLEVGDQHRARCHFTLAPGWVAPVERLTLPADEWDPRVRAAEEAHAAVEAAARARRRPHPASLTPSAGLSAIPDEVLVRVRDLTKYFPVTRGALLRRKVGDVRAVDGVSFQVRRGATFGLVGESGCGKSTIARVMLKLLRATSGAVEFEGDDILPLDGRATRALRGDMQIVFQDPYASLNPRFTVYQTISEPLLLAGRSKEATQARVGELLDLCGLAREHARRYPHEFSGGQRQRIGIARALALDPKLLVLDEPVSALDVSIQAQVINLLEDLQGQLGLTYLFIAHDLSVIRHIADEVAVMYLGQIVETARRTDLFERPKHPYTTALLSAVPIPDPLKEKARERIILVGDPPSPAAPPAACRFHTRCWKAQDVCRTVAPPLELKAPGHWAACHFPENIPVS